MSNPRFFNPFHQRAVLAALERGLSVSGTPQAESSEIVKNGGACVGLALEDCADGQCFQSGLKRQREFEQKSKGGSILDQAGLASRMSGADGSVSLAKPEEIDQKMSGKGSKMFVFNGKNGEHAMRLDVMGKNQCRLFDSNVGKISGECERVRDFQKHLLKQYGVSGSVAITPIGKKV